MMTSTSPERTSVKSQKKCGVCLAEVTDFVSCSVDCGQVICNSCFSEIIWNGIGNRVDKDVHKKKCLFSSQKNCLGYYYLPNTSKQLLPLMQHMKFMERLEFERLQELQITHGIFTCRCKIGNFAIPKEEMRKLQNIRCLNCDSVLCSYCHESHGGKNCAKLSVFLSCFTTEYKKGQKKRHTRNLKPCPQCCQAVEKVQGCLHITCKCNYQFCWNCGSSCFLFFFYNKKKHDNFFFRC